MLTLEERLNIVLEKFIERGVVDIKFHFNENVLDTPIDEVKEGLVRILEADLAGELKPMKPINDRYLAFRGR